MRLFYLILTCSFLFSCKQQKVETLEKELLKKPKGEVIINKHFLSFPDLNSFKECLKNNGRFQASTRSNEYYESSFYSIAKLRKEIKTRSENKETTSRLEYQLSKAEKLIVDPALEQIIDTTFTLKVENTLIKIDSLGTFSVDLLNTAEKLDIPIEGTEEEKTNKGFKEIETAIKNFDIESITVKGVPLKAGESITFTNGITFTNSFPKTNDNYCTEVYNETSSDNSHSFNLYTPYNVKKYKFKNNSIFQKILDFLRGKDVSKKNYFDSKHRVKLSVFDVNYGIYTATGIKVQMQKRHKIWFVKYWREMKTDSIILGFNELGYQIKFNSPIRYNKFTPANYSKWESFTANFNNTITKFVYGSDTYTKLKTIFDRTDIFAFLPQWNISGYSLESLKLSQKLFNTSSNLLFKFLHKQIGKHVYTPLKHTITPQDPKYICLLDLETPSAYKTQRIYTVGTEKSAHASRKQFIINRSFGLTFFNNSILPFTPSTAKFITVDVFGAAYYHGKWKGVRISDK